MAEDGVGGTPDVVITTLADNIRPAIELDVSLNWSFDEVYQLNIDLEEVFDGLELDEDIAQFAKGLVAFGGEGLTEMSGGLSLTIGIGLELEKKECGDKSSKAKILPYIKGATGLDLFFQLTTDTIFTASIGPFTANVDIAAMIDNYGDDLSISFGLIDTLNYYLSSDKSLARDGFVVVPSPKNLVDELDVTISGRIEGRVEADLAVPLGFGNGHALVEFSVSDVNNLIQQTPGAFAVFYEVSFEVEVPSFIDILLMDPEGIVNALDGVFKQAESFSLGKNGVVTKFQGKH